MNTLISASKNTANIMVRASVSIFLLSCLQVKAQSYTVGVPVCDTLCRASYVAACSKDFLAMALDSTLIPYVTGLDFQVQVTAVNGYVSSNVSDTVKAGDIFPLPASSESGSLVINLPEENDSFEFIIRVIGTPLVAGEKYFCNPRCVQTTSACQNGLTVLAEPSRDSTCTVQSHTNSVGYNGDLPTMTRYELKQNYPNPFNTATIIEFHLPHPSQVSLEIFNLHGEKVATLLDRIKFMAGAHKINWQAGGVTSGLYFYHWRANDFVETKKLILLK